MTQTPLISVRSLSMGFGRRTIMEDLDFDIYPGEIFVILGGSGCGKSTLLKHLMGIYSPLHGSIHIAGQKLQPEDSRSYQQILRHIGVMYQGGALFSSMTLAENVALPLQEFTPLDAEAIQELVQIKLAQVGLEAFADHLPEELSGGMKKRGAIARALALNPEILFLDEPSAGLDPISSAELDELILQINKMQGTTFVIVTHELPSIFSIANRVIMLDKNTKSIIANDDPRHLRDTSTHPFVHRFFNRQATQEN